MQIIFIKIVTFSGFLRVVKQLNITPEDKTYKRDCLATKTSL